MLDFKGIIGHNAVKTHLLNAVRTGRVSHAYMLIGEKGMGRRTIADAFALTLFCEKGGTEPCRSCHACRQVLAGTHPDLIYITHEKPATISVDEVREQLAETVGIRPFSGGKKVYIMPDADRMTVQAQNALLKTIEEPPDYAVILLLAENDEALLETIRSRVVKLRLKPLPQETVERWLIEKKGIGEKDARLAAGFSRGNPGLALSLAGSEEFRTNYGEDLKLLSRLPDAGMQEILADIRSVKEREGGPDTFLAFFRMYLRDILMIKTGAEKQGVIFSDHADELFRASRRLSYEKLGQLLDGVERAEDRLSANCNPELILEILFMSMKEGTHL